MYWHKESTDEQNSTFRASLSCVCFVTRFETEKKGANAGRGRGYDRINKMGALAPSSLSFELMSQPYSMEEIIIFHRFIDRRGKNNKFNISSLE